MGDTTYVPLIRSTPTVSYACRNEREFTLPKGGTAEVKVVPESVSPRDLRVSLDLPGSVRIASDIFDKEEGARLITLVNDVEPKRAETVGLELGLSRETAAKRNGVSQVELRVYEVIEDAPEKLGRDAAFIQKAQGELGELFLHGNPEPISKDRVRDEVPFDVHDNAVSFMRLRDYLHVDWALPNEPSQLYAFKVGNRTVYAAYDVDQNFQRKTLALFAKSGKLLGYAEAPKDAQAWTWYPAPKDTPKAWWP